ncbi:splicing factor, proline- and glutamine-rich [Ixodes scapularis]|uniref:Proline and glutamine-rich splicing factor (SFPQ), putative n=1 Tax=Ixodes scapularis TaxID=6945 RepID=B7P595_IXOSC|nr:splicing factor, proline- and glutamine-rich [Ixodes scapularis]XP_042144068.1 splicing factor, proline- and glutamine-rich [Ixodes scapularis]EEC01767.1 proline and glutamine-rich splicing factor (SFPQ), putative [Ixodes scapularis]|eukprot:XP_002407174.1 proline and glutamine-rich splicing factor (SFPQ), putative [Ixodes scapularis]
MSGRRGSSYPPRHSPYGGGGGGSRYGRYEEHNSHYNQHDGQQAPRQQQQSPHLQQAQQKQPMPPPQQKPPQKSPAPQKTPPPQQQTPPPQKPPVQQQTPPAAQKQPTPKKEVPQTNSQEQPPVKKDQKPPTPVTTPNSNSKPTGENADNCKLFVSNVPNVMTDEMFRKMFEEQGEVRDIFLNKTKWFGFVLYKTHDQAEKALKALDGAEKNGRRLRVRYATQQKPEELRAAQALQAAQAAGQMPPGPFPGGQGGYQGGPGFPPQGGMQQSPQQGMAPPQPKRSGARCRLFVGNLAPSMTEEEFRKLFSAYGELVEVFLHSQKGFGFIKYEQRQQAEAAKTALDNVPRDGKYLQVRFATQGSSLKVKNLSPFVSNELLEDAFSIFGEIDRAVVIVDDRGRSVGEGIVEFARKTSAMAALKKATQGCLLLTSSPRPVLVEPLDLRDEEDGFPEKNVNKNNPQFLKEREVGPRFAEPGTFEFEFSSRWKKLLELEKQKREFLERELEDERRKLEEEMEYYRYEHETRLLREQLRIMEEQSKIFAHEREMRLQEQKRRDEIRRQEEMLLRQREEDILGFPRREQGQAQHPQHPQHPQHSQHSQLAEVAAAVAAVAAQTKPQVEGATFVSSYDNGGRTEFSRFDQPAPGHFGGPDDGRRAVVDDYADRDPKRRRY